MGLTGRLSLTRIIVGGKAVPAHQRAYCEVLDGSAPALKVCATLVISCVLSCLISIPSVSEDAECIIQGDLFQVQ